MDKYDLDDAMPQNYIGYLTYTYVDVTSLPRLPLGETYTAHGYTCLDTTNPDGEDLELKVEYEWPFHHYSGIHNYLHTYVAQTFQFAHTRLHKLESLCYSTVRRFRFKEPKVCIYFWFYYNVSKL